jgi:hypothetical protein
METNKKVVNLSVTMETELKIFNLAFRPLSDEGEEEVDLGDDDAADLDAPDPDKEDDGDDGNSTVPGMGV